jgi:hypothetical protein
MREVDSAVVISIHIHAISRGGLPTGTNTPAHTRSSPAPLSNAMEEEQDVMPALLKLPPLALEAVANALEPGSDIASAICLLSACKALRSLDTPMVWERWITRRFGDEVLPAKPPTGMQCGGSYGRRGRSCIGRRAAVCAYAAPPHPVDLKTSPNRPPRPDQGRGGRGLHLCPGAAAAGRPPQVAAGLHPGCAGRGGAGRRCVFGWTPGLRRAALSTVTNRGLEQEPALAAVDTPPFLNSQNSIAHSPKPPFQQAPRRSPQAAPCSRA